MASIDAANLSLEPAVIRQLSVEQKDRLTELLDGYLASLEEGVPASREELLSAHPDLAEPLQAYLQSLDDLHAAADRFAGAAERAPAEPPASDERRLGDFRIVREIGRGGMGVVYEARQISLGRRVALKVLPFAAVLDSRQIARFKHEAQAAAQLDHPNIVSVYAVGMERGVHYFAMQFIDGQPLDRALRELQRAAGVEPAADDHDSARADAEPAAAETVDFRRSTVRPFLTGKTADRREFFRTVAELGAQAARALHAAHEHGVVHRDVKPSNLLLDGDGKLWITDFGLARRLADATLTRTGEVVGTLRYMSPEQAQGQPALVDHRTDVYSLGATLYELLTLHPAFPGNDGPALLRHIEQHEPRRPRDLQPHIPADLETVVLKALSKRRDDRYATARDFADDLQRVLDGRPTIARPPTVFDRLARWSRRHQRMMAAAVGASLLAVLGMATSMFLIAQERNRAEANFSRAERHFHEAREAVDRLGAQVADRLAAAPGAQKLRGELLRETLAYYRSFVQQAGEDPALRGDLALTYGKIGALTAEIGSADEAVAALRSAIELLRQLAAENPREADYRARLAVAYSHLALAHRRAGRTDEARRAYGEAIQLQEQLVAKSGSAKTDGAKADSAEQFWSDLAISQTGLGLLQSETGAVKEAEASFRKALALSERLLERRPDHPQHRRSRAAVLNNLSALFVAAQPARAAELYRQSLEEHVRAAAARPDDLQCQSEAALAYNNLGAVQLRLNQLTAAAAAHRRAVEILNDVVRAAPTQHSYRHDLAVAFNHLGLSEHKAGRPAEAERAFRQALDLQLALVRQVPQNLEMQCSLGGIYNNLGMVEEGLQRGDVAARSYQAAVEHQREACSHAPQVSRYRDFLSMHYYNYGRVLRQLGRASEAVDVALQRRELWPNDPHRLFTVAEELAQASGLLASAPQVALPATRSIELTLETLRQAQAAGWKPPAGTAWREAFAALRDRPDFAALLRE